MKKMAVFISAVMLSAAPAFAGEYREIQDNSFLIEEAYNQEAGVVQHIGSFRRQGKDRFFAFTQELPLGSQAPERSRCFATRKSLRGTGSGRPTSSRPSSRS